MITTIAKEIDIPKNNELMTRSLVRVFGLAMSSILLPCLISPSVNTLAKYSIRFLFIPVSLSGLAKSLLAA
jgi:hypothetical protein